MVYTLSIAVAGLWRKYEPIYSISDVCREYPGFDISCAHHGELHCVLHRGFNQEGYHPLLQHETGIHAVPGREEQRSYLTRQKFTVPRKERMMEETQFLETYNEVVPYHGPRWKEATMNETIFLLASTPTTAHKITIEEDT